LIFLAKQTSPKEKNRRRRHLLLICSKKEKLFPSSQWFVSWKFSSILQKGEEEMNGRRKFEKKFLVKPENFNLASAKPPSWNFLLKNPEVWIDNLKLLESLDFHRLKFYLLFGENCVRLVFWVSEQTKSLYVEQHSRDIEIISVVDHCGSSNKIRFGHKKAFYLLQIIWTPLFLLRHQWQQVFNLFAKQARKKPFLSLETMKIRIKI